MNKLIIKDLYAKSLVHTKLLRNRVLSNELLNNDLLWLLFLLSIIVNGFGLIFPVLISSDANLYAVIAKHILTNQDWVNLTYANTDWLDKPHLPFWLTALSYHLFGINSFAYMLPGFIFHLIGARYIYLIAKRMYSYQVGMVATIIYLTVIRIMLVSLDVRAEAYLLGEIIPACYFWLVYSDNEQIKVNALFAGAVFTAMAVMTKGIFVLLPIFSGIFCCWVFKRHWKEYNLKKWVLAICLSGIFVLPELITLFIQFDLHPEKIVFGHNNVSGIKFFVWDSQFGRFFNNGPISTTHVNLGVMHYLYFVHTFLWAFLPWTMIFFVGIATIYRVLLSSSDVPNILSQKLKYIYLLGSIVPTFLLFSISKFQLEYYIVIILPFATIICAVWLCNYSSRYINHWIFTAQVIIAYILCACVILVTILLFNGRLLWALLSLSILCIVTMFIIFKNNRPVNKAIVYSVITSCLLLVCLILVNDRVSGKYDGGYNIARYLNKRDKLVVVDYKVHSTSLEFHSINYYIQNDNIDQIRLIPKPLYLVTSTNDWEQIKNNFPINIILTNFVNAPENQVQQSLFNNNKLKNITTNLVVVLILQSPAVAHHITAHESMSMPSVLK
jgi:4-amino-4-deoxy-L-arabinose transferase-like glycosyltransferase